MISRRTPICATIVERNLEVAAQCCIDIASRLIGMEGAQKPSDYQEAIARLGEIGVSRSSLPGSSR